MEKKHGRFFMLEKLSQKITEIVVNEGKWDLQILGRKVILDNKSFTTAKVQVQALAFSINFELQKPCSGIEDCNNYHSSDALDCCRTVTRGLEQYDEAKYKKRHSDRRRRCLITECRHQYKQV